MPSPSTPLNFNDLLDEILHLVFSFLTPEERALVSSTCKEWHGIIMGTKSYWREVKVGKDASVEKMQTKLRVFNQRSSFSLRVVVIDRKINNQPELDRVFYIIAPSARTIRKVLLRQAPTLNLYTRILSRLSFPALQVLCTQAEIQMGKVFKMRDPEETWNGLEVYLTDLLVELHDEDELEWLSRLQCLEVEISDSPRAIRSILESCKGLVTLSVNGIFHNTEPNSHDSIIIVDFLKVLHLPVSPPSRPPIRVDLTAPNLKALVCRIDQLESVQASSLQQLFLVLEDPGDEEWDEQKLQDYSRKCNGCFSSKPRILELIILGDIPGGARKVQGQLQGLIKTLACSADKVPICPNLKQLTINPIQEANLEALARTVISREIHSTKTSGRNRFRVSLQKHDTQIFKKFKRIKQKIENEERASFEKM